MTTTTSPATTSTAIDGFLADVLRGSMSSTHYAHTGRHVHVIDLDDTGAIVSDHVWRGGRWPADLLAQMEPARHAR